jgi:HlyD family secretion protein
VSLQPHRPRVLVVTLTLAIAVVAGWWYWSFRGPPPPVYVTAAVARGTVARTVTATGTVNPVMTIIVGSNVSGVIRDVSCDYNTEVRKGQICAKIDPRPYAAALAEAEGALARDSGQLSGARADLARYAVLVEQHQIAEITFSDQTALVHQLEGQVQLDRAAVRNARVNLGYTNIVSPVNGTVVARNITIGQTVAASFQTPTLFLIAQDLTHMEVDTNVSESDIGAVNLGDAADFTVLAYAGRTFRGKVVQVRQAPQVVQNVVTYDAVIGVDNPKLLLKPGMTATVGIVTEQRTDVLRVPDQALRFTPGGLGSAAASQQMRVWVLRQGKPVAVPVHAGLDDGTDTEIDGGGLRLGDPVIVGERRRAASAQAGTSPFRL